MVDKFVRFVTADREPVTGLKVGFFDAAYELSRSGVPNEADIKTLTTALRWFETNLNVPTRFSKTARPHAHGKAFSWFKPAASEHISKSRDVLKVLVRYGTQSEMLTSRKPGVIVFEDSFQIAAIPFKSRDF
ncbi:MAG: hypothetical protein AAGC77_11425 [Pseudomonadota bacterium]